MLTLEHLIFEKKNSERFAYTCLGFAFIDEFTRLTLTVTDLPTLP